MTAPTSTRTRTYGEADIMVYNPGDMTAYNLVLCQNNQQVLLFGLGVAGRQGNFFPFNVDIGTPSFEYVNEKMFGKKGDPYLVSLALHLLCYFLGVLPYKNERNSSIMQMVINTCEVLPIPITTESEWHSL